MGKTVRVIKKLPEDNVTTLICGEEDGALVQLGDIALMDDGSAVVMNDWEGILQFFDSHDEAIRYVETRICEEPIYAR